VTVLAIDVGGTKLEAALVDPAGRIVPGSRSRAATGRETEPRDLQRLLADAVGRTLGAATDAVAGVGIGSAGPVDRRAGRISPVNMPQLAGFAVREALEALVPGVPVALALDGQCIALAETRFGAARDAHSTLGMVVSTGVGGGLVLDGRLIPGATGNAGHVGQMHTAELDEHGRPLTVEAVASGPASVAWARERGWEGTTGEELAAGWARGDAVPRDAVLRSARAVGALVADVWTLADLEVVVIGGGFSHVAPEYPELVTEAAAERAELDYARAPRVVRAALGHDAPLVGAAALALA
jgi:glucokinase